MTDRTATRRQVLELTAALFAGAAMTGCRKGSQEMIDEPEPTLGWQTISAGDDALGPRSRHGLAYDRNTNVAVLFGGVVWRNSEWDYRSDTWELRGKRWAQINTAETPSARQRAAMTYLPNQKQTLLFGGQAARGGYRGRVWAGLLDDSWAYSDSAWRRQRLVGPVPLPRCSHCLCYDEQNGCAVLFGGCDADDRPLGDTWQFDGTAWKKVLGAGPPARRSAAFTYDPELKACLLHGGSEDDAGKRKFGDTWVFRDNVWKSLGDDFETDPRDDHSMAYHHCAKRLVLLEGIAAERGLLVREANGWEAVKANPIHPRHQCSPLVWDESLGGILLHGGEAGHEGHQFDKTLLLRMPAAP